MASEEFRRVNGALGIQPRIGPFNIYQLVPLLLSLTISFVLKDLLGFDWLVMALFVGGLTGSSIAILGDKPWLFFAQIKSVPYIVRGGAMYQPLLREEENGD